MTDKKTFIVKGYSDIESALVESQDKSIGVWIGESDKALGRWVYVTVNRGVFVNVGPTIHKFHSFSEAINYITEFLFN